jgi:cytochrome oxidase Cu insertion factor (SCO1/SenC/PrrC family)
MTRWAIVAAMLAFAAVQDLTPRLAAHAEPAVEASAWRAAGITPLPGGLQAPPFHLDDLSGKTVDIQQFRGRLVMLYFWATW